MFWVVAEEAQAVVIKVLASALAVGARFKQAKKFQEELANLLVDTLFEQAEEPCGEEAEAKEEQAEEDSCNGTETHGLEL